MRAAGELRSLADMRAVAGASSEPEVYEPSSDRDGAASTYRRFLDATGLRAAAAA
jgi:rhamnulokinase